MRREKPQGPTLELHRQALYSSPGPEHWALWWRSSTWLQMDATSEGWWQQHWSPHLNKPPTHPPPPAHIKWHSWPTWKPKSTRAERVEWKKATRRVVEGCRTVCTNRPLRCCHRLLFSLAGAKKKLSPTQEREEKHTYTKDDRVFIQVPLILEQGGRHTLERQEASIAQLVILQGLGWSSLWCLNSQCRSCQD